MGELPIVPRRRRTEELRKGRISLAGAAYFVTFSTARRAPTLAGTASISAAHEVCRRLAADGDVSELTATVMPDHVHLLFRLGAKLTLERVVAKWRTLVWRSVLGLEWQGNFYEHRLRPDEATESYARYIFMNPYRAKLAAVDEVWPGWWTDGQIAYEFLALARPGPCPCPEWVVEAEVRARELQVGGDE